MASVDDCGRALADLATRLGGVEDDVRARNAPDRTLSLRLSDLDISFSGRIHEGSLTDVVVVDDDDSADRAQLRLQCSSDDLLALTDGSLNPAAAWASGRLRIDASPLDLLRLRSLF